MQQEQTTALESWEYFVYSQINFINPTFKTKDIKDDQTITIKDTNLQDNDD